MPIENICWENRVLTILDQTRLPVDQVRIELRSVESVWEAIKKLRVRGAPAIGICAAFGVLVALEEKGPDDVPGIVAVVDESADYLASSRPTAVNLMWAVERMKRVARENARNLSADELARRLEAEASAILEEDKALCLAISEHGAPLIQDGDGVLTHCNAGGLATSGHYGTALGVMLRAHELGRRFAVFADETRPLLQGARLTTWELMQSGIDVTLICDGMAAQVMREGRIQLVIVGADRIAANGDAANKIGTYSAAVNAAHHKIPFYVAAPFSTFDLSLPDGSHIPIEQRDAGEISHGFGRQTAPDGVEVYNPAFDVTPAELIAGIITEKGVLRAPYTESIREASS